MAQPSYLRIPGTKTHELPPLMVNIPPSEAQDLAYAIEEADELLSGSDTDERVIEARRFDLAINLTEQYRRLLARWSWGNAILEWIRQCEITFEADSGLQNLLRHDLWPHAGRSSFVSLLVDKRIPAAGYGPERAVGLRLAFRQPPPIQCCSDQFLLYLNSCVADSAYHAWAGMAPEDTALLPPERFHFEVVDLDVEPA